MLIFTLDCRYSEEINTIKSLFEVIDVYIRSLEDSVIAISSGVYIIAVVENGLMIKVSLICYTYDYCKRLRILIKLNVSFH